MGKGEKSMDPVEAAAKAMEKYKKRMWRMCKCGTFWSILAIVLVVTGIALMAAFTKYWGEEGEWKRGLAYTGLAFILLGIVFLAVGIVLCTILCVIYRKLNQGEYGNHDWYKPPQFEYGSAPYPQQEPPPKAPQQQPPSQDPSAPMMPPPPGGHETDPGKVHVEVSDHHKF